MQVTLGEKGLGKTQQADFPETFTEPHISRRSKGGDCDGEFRIAFVAHEDFDRDLPAEEQKFVCDLHVNRYHDGEAWLHDVCSVAVYFCKKCLKATVHWNQG